MGKARRFIIEMLQNRTACWNGWPIRRPLWCGQSMGNKISGVTINCTQSVIEISLWSINAECDNLLQTFTSTYTPHNLSRLSSLTRHFKSRPRLPVWLHSNASYRATDNPVSPSSSFPEYDFFSQRLTFNRFFGISPRSPNDIMGE